MTDGAAADALRDMERTFDDEMTMTRAHVAKMPDSPERDRMMAVLASHSGDMDAGARDIRERVRDGYITRAQAAGYLLGMIGSLQKMRSGPPSRPTTGRGPTLEDLEAIRRRLAVADEPHGLDALVREAMIGRSTVQSRYKGAPHRPGDPIPGVCDAKGSTHPH